MLLAPTALLLTTTPHRATVGPATPLRRAIIADPVIPLHQDPRTAALRAAVRQAADPPTVVRQARLTAVRPVHHTAGEDRLET